MSKVTLKQRKSANMNFKIYVRRNQVNFLVYEQDLKKNSLVGLQNKNNILHSNHATTEENIRNLQFMIITINASRFWFFI